MPMQEPNSGIAGAGAVCEHLVQPELADHAHRRRERADPGQQDAVGGAQLVVVAGDQSLRAPTRCSAFSTDRRLPIP